VAKTWKLDTGTKGTGAHIVPLDRPERAEPARDELSVVPLKRRPEPRPEPEPRAPRQFKIIDVVTRETLAEHVDTRTALRVLRDVRNNVDVQVYVSEPGTGAWRLLSLKEQRALWDARHRVPGGRSPRL
jgi:hypothetical protein